MLTGKEEVKRALVIDGTGTPFVFVDYGMVSTMERIDACDFGKCPHECCVICGACCGCCRGGPGDE